MRLKYSATFEFETSAPLTATGHVVAAQMPTGLRLAGKQLAAQYPGRSWTSVVVVVEKVAPEAVEGTEARGVDSR